MFHHEIIHDIHDADILSSKEYVMDDFQLELVLFAVCRLKRNIDTLVIMLHDHMIIINFDLFKLRAGEEFLLSLLRFE